jgi:sulfide:quinone oxidoreductase
MARVVILGGGFGGLSAATTLAPAAAAGHEVWVVDRAPTFRMGLRKLWTLVGLEDPTSGTRSRKGLERHGARWLHDEVVAVDLTVRRVRTTTTELPYDFLVVALGAEPRPDPVAGLPRAFNLYDPDAVERRAAEVQGLSRGRLVVGILGLPYKCPPAPYEAAMLLDDLLRRRGVRESMDLRVFTPQPSSLPVAGPAGCATVEGQLQAKGIHFEPNRKVVRVEADRVVFEGGELPYDYLLAVPAHQPPAVVRESGLADGWVRVDPRTMRTRDERVFAVGDVVEIPMANGMPLPKAGVFAEAQGRVAASWILSELGLGGRAVEFDGSGYCFVEVGGGRAAKVQGRFLAQPVPEVVVSPPSPEAWAEKRAFERERLDAWL